jgi:hypothetical protein
MAGNYYKRMGKRNTVNLTGFYNAPKCYAELASIFNYLIMREKC